MTTPAPTPHRTAVGTAATVFLSYSHDSDEHVEWVLTLSATLAQHDITVIVDAVSYDRRLPWNAFMVESIHRADFVLIVGTRGYKEKAEDLRGLSGASVESVIALSDFYRSPQKYVPLARESVDSGEPALPFYLQNYDVVDFRDDARFDAALEKLLRLILNVPRYAIGTGEAVPHGLLTRTILPRPRLRPTLREEVDRNLPRLRREFLDFFYYPDAGPDGEGGSYPYIRPAMSRQHPRSATAERVPADRMLDEFLASDRPVWTVLGEYGTGKSAFCYDTAFTVAAREGDERWLPVNVACRASPTADLDDPAAWLSRMLAAPYGASAETQVRWSFTAKQLVDAMRNERVLLIIDGFDEISLPAGWTPESALAAFVAYLGRLPGKSILTLRDTFVGTAPAPPPARRSLFTTVVDRPAPAATAFRSYLVEFSDEQVGAYLAGCRSGARVIDGEELRRHPTLVELSHKPVFAHFLAEAEGLELGADITPVGLYSYLVDHWISTAREPGTLTAAQIATLLQELAFLMFVANRRELSVPMLTRFVESQMPGADAEAVVRDITTRSFLVRTHLETVVFSHNTIMEFLVAKRLAEQLLRWSNADLYVRLLTHAINDFLVALLHRAEQEAGWLTTPRRDLSGMVLVEQDDRYDEGLQVRVGSFYICRDPITGEQYAEFLRAKPSMIVPCSEGRELLHQLGNRPDVDWFVMDVDGYLAACAPLCWDANTRVPPRGMERWPVIYVSYYDAWAYCRWAGLSLPTYAEWVKAGAWDRESGTIHEYPVRGEPQPGVNCNCAGVVGEPVPVDAMPEACAVGTACRHMLGNVAEWTDEWFDASRTYRIIAGGGWSTGVEHGGVATAAQSFPSLRRNFVGFRPVLRIR